jgi:hypothetical protein
MVLPQSNPFSTRAVRPGAIPFVFAAGESAGWLVDRLRTSGWWGQIVGSHGSGKSTLLASLIPALEAAGRGVHLVTLHDGQRRLPTGLDALERGNPSLQLVIDGYEQLSRWSRWKIKRFCRRQKCGLLVTSHADVGLPELFVVQPRLETARRIAEHLLPPGSQSIGPDDVARSFERHGGDLRETLFDLYDLYEARRPQQT